MELQNWIILCVAVIISISSTMSKSVPSIMFEYPEQWQTWKTDHEKNYTSQLEELDRHLVWLSNKKYIDTHNTYDHVFGYTLKLNQFADMVSIKTCKTSSITNSYKQLDMPFDYIATDAMMLHTQKCKVFIILLYKLCL